MRLQIFGLRFEVGRAVRRTTAPRLPPATDFAGLPAWDFALRRIHLLNGRSVATFLREQGEDPDAFVSILVAAEGYRTERGGTDLVYAALEELAQVALRHGCAYVVDPTALGHNGFSSRASSGFGLGLGGLAFGFASPDGTFSQALHLVATGLVPRPSGS